MFPRASRSPAEDAPGTRVYLNVGKGTKIFFWEQIRRKLGIGSEESLINVNSFDILRNFGQLALTLFMMI